MTIIEFTKQHIPILYWFTLIFITPLVAIVAVFFMLSKICLPYIWLVGMVWFGMHDDIGSFFWWNIGILWGMWIFQGILSNITEEKMNVDDITNELTNNVDLYIDYMGHLNNNK